MRKFVALMAFCVIANMARAQIEISPGLFSTVRSVEGLKPSNGFTIDISHTWEYYRINMFLKSETYIKDSISIFSMGMSGDIFPFRYQSESSVDPFVYFGFSAPSNDFKKDKTPYSVLVGGGMDYKMYSDYDDFRATVFIKSGYQIYTTKIHDLNLNGWTVNVGVRFKI